MKHYIRKILKFIFKSIGYKGVDELLNIFISLKEKKYNIFIGVTNLPQYSEKINNNYDCDFNYEKVAIVIQGPPDYNDNFTIETIKLYKKYFPGAAIILSTWDNVKTEFLKRSEEEKIFIIQNTIPDYAGFANINFQIKSTISGIKMAKELRKNYVLKTRTDQRIYNHLSLSLFSHIQHIFPLEKIIDQKKRLIVTNLITLKYRLYSISDMLMYGQIDDMLEYWDVLPDNRIIKTESTKYSMNFTPINRLGETYFTTNFILKKNEKLKNDFKQYYSFLKDRFCVIDYKMIDLFWNKYNRNNGDRYNNYDYVNSLQRLSFTDWLNIYLGQQSINEINCDSIIESELIPANYFKKKINHKNS